MQLPTDWLYSGLCSACGLAQDDGVQCVFSCGTAVVPQRGPSSNLGGIVPCAARHVRMLCRCAGGNKGPMENPAKHLVYRPTTMQLLSILTTTVEIMPKVGPALLHTSSCLLPLCEYLF
jgi:hypothetical protein